MNHAAGPGPGSTSLMVVAGEASGDLHAARLLESLRPLCGPIEAFGLGGDELQNVGLQAVAHSREVSVVGITEVLRILPRARAIFRLLLEQADRRRPALAVLVDFPDFNLRLAKELRKRGIPVVYYISPQVWAWRRGRLKTIARCVNEMLVLFPFELAWYEDHGVAVQHVGHPLVDEVPELTSVWDRADPTGSGYRLAVLPGSRSSEIRSLAPVMLAAARLLSERVPGLSVRLIRAPTVDESELNELVAAAGVEAEIVHEDRFRAIADSHVALCASGTATLEVGMLGTPMVVLYRLQRWSYWLGRLLVDLPSFSLVNLVLGASVVPELMQAEANPERAAAEALRWLEDDTARATVRSELGRLRSVLGEKGASARAAAHVARRLCPAGAAA